MRLEWTISRHDVLRVRAVVISQANNPLVLARKHRNLAGKKPIVGKHRFWRALVSCLLTTQQRSGPKSAVTRFLATRPFPLAYRVCRATPHLQTYTARAISTFGGIRRGPTLAIEIADNFSRLEGGLWPQVLHEVRRLNRRATRNVEVDVANFIDRTLVGFGPKQARNLLQDLGLTRYEIPIDSRISRWLRDFGFPVSLSPAALSDAQYYHFVSTAIVELCERSGVLPCIFDASVFSSFDSN